jgi:NTE family protein
MKSTIAVIALAASLLFNAIPAAFGQAPPAASDARRPTIGLALGGGGVRGTAHIGVLRVLEREKIPIDFIAGTSMGAIVGGLYSAGIPLDQINKKFHDGSMLGNYLTVPIPVRLALVPLFFIPHLFGYHPLDGFYRGNKFAKYLNNSVPPEKRTLESLNIPFVAVATNLLNGKEFTIEKGNFGRALQASSAIPVLRQPVIMDDGLLVDGGIAANVPIVPAKDMHPDILIAVDVNANLNTTEVKQYRKIGSVSKRLLTIYLSVQASEKLKLADVVIHPDVDAVPLLTGNLKKADQAIAAGEAATKDAIPAIRAAIQNFQGTKAAVAGQ